METVTSPLDNLCGPGKPLRREVPGVREFEGLKTSGAVRLEDAQNPDVSLEGRFDLAYNSAHALCLAALRWHGFRSTNRYVVFQVLPHTLGLGPEVWRVLAKCHEVRNLSEYEGGLDIDHRIVHDLIGACRAVKKKLEQLGPLEIDGR